MSFKRYQEDLEEVVEDEFSHVRLPDALESSVRQRLATVETRDTVEKLQPEEVTRARNDILEKLDETFERLAADRRSLEGDDIQRKDLGGTTTGAHILYGFPEIGAEVQEKYMNVRNFIESSVCPEGIAQTNIEAYKPTLIDEEQTTEKLVDYFCEEINENGMTVDDIESDDVPEALRSIYTEEEYRMQISDNLDPTRMVPKMEPDLIELFEDLEGDSSSVKQAYLDRVAEFGEYASERMRDVFPYSTPEEIFD